MKSLTNFAAVFWFLVCFHLDACAQSQEKVYSTVILNFSKGIEWPKELSRENFTIGVFEYEPLAIELLTMGSSMKVSNKKIEIRNIRDIAEIDGCHILFLPAYKAKSMTAILNKLGKSPTLIITNKVDMARKGSGVNFVLQNGKLKYEINCKSIEERGMKISANIKGMGIIVED